MKRNWGICAVVLFAWSSCIDNSGEMLQLMNAIAPKTPECAADPATTVFYSSGTRDILLNPLSAYGYQMAALLRNSADTVDDYPLRFGNNINVLVDSNDVTVDGFNLCYEFLYFRKGTEVSGKPPPVMGPSCKDLKAPVYFVSAMATVQAGGGKAATFVDLFPPAVTGISNTVTYDTLVTQDQIDAHKKANVASVEGLTDAQVAAVILRVRYQAAVAKAIAAQNSNSFMKDLDSLDDYVRVVTHVQAIGRTRDQRRIKSNEMIFPVNVCFGCLSLGCDLDLTSVCAVGQDLAGKCAAG